MKVGGWRVRGAVRAVLRQRGDGGVRRLRRGVLRAVLRPAAPEGEPHQAQAEARAVVLRLRLPGRFEKEKKGTRERAHPS